jgi:lipopolysaccharide transport system permease protein
MAEFFRYRELFYFLVWRDVKVRYKQTLLGAAWAILQPFCMMVVFTLFFGRNGQVDTGGVPYPVFSYAAWCHLRISSTRSRSRATALFPTPS